MDTRTSPLQGQKDNLECIRYSIGDTTRSLSLVARDLTLVSTMFGLSDHKRTSHKLFEHASVRIILFS